MQLDRIPTTIWQVKTGRRVAYFTSRDEAREYRREQTTDMPSTLLKRSVEVSAPVATRG